MSGLEVLSFWILPIAAAILSWNDQCGVLHDDEPQYGPRDACPEIICSSSSSDSVLSQDETMMTLDNTLLSDDSSDQDDDEPVYKFDPEGSYYSL